MNQPIQAQPVCGINGCQTANGGETIVFGLRLGDKSQNEDVNFAMSYDLLPPLIANLLGIGHEADELRAKNPIHQGANQSGYVLDLQTLSIGLHGKKKGWHVLQFHVKGAGGTTRYLIAADRTRLENLTEALLTYLDDMESSDRGSATPH